MTDYQTEALTPEHVDLDKPLSDDMKTWLISRNRADLVEENARRLGAQDDAEVAKAREDAAKAAQQQIAKGQQQSQLSGGQLVTGPEAEDEGDDYDTWTAKELQEEAGERGLSKSGTKEELIARLRANDAEQTEE